MPEKDLATRIAALKNDVRHRDTLRAQAETTVSHAKQQLADVDARLKELGIDPDQAETELVALETKLETAVTELSERVGKEIEACRTVITDANKVFGAQGATT